eukprot:gene12911-8768_t
MSECQSYFLVVFKRIIPQEVCPMKGGKAGFYIGKSEENFLFCAAGKMNHLCEAGSIVSAVYPQPGSILSHTSCESSLTISFIYINRLKGF